MNINKLKLNRRAILKAAATASLSTVVPVYAGADDKAPGKKDKLQELQAAPWSNWSGNQSCQPHRRLMPSDENQLVDIIKETTGSMRFVGAGHSFSSLVPTRDTLVSLAMFQGVQHIDKKNKQVDIKAGSRLATIGQPLWDEGLALLNMPDINMQELAGAVATSTHGTGISLGSMSDDVVSLRMIDASGKVLDCSADKNSELFAAGRTAFGALGPLTNVRLQVRDAYKLKEHSWMMPLEEGLERAEELRDNNRHFEMYALPHGDYILGITLNETTEADREDKSQGSAYEAFRTLSKVVNFLPFMRSFIVNSGARTVEEEFRVGRSYEIFGNVRDILFNEMEYSVPAEYGVRCLKEILETIKKQNVDVVFPLEYRYVKADDIWLSPFYQRDSCSISCHNFHDEDYKQYFSVIEPIFWKYDGRPHWGKINTLGKRQFAGMYPHWNDFLRLRKEIDPQGKFLNSYLKTLFDVA